MATRIFLILLLINCYVIGNSQTNETRISEKDYFIKAHEMAANEFNDSLLQEYVKIYPKGKFIDKAETTIDVCAWQNARYTNTKESYEQYIKDFPKGQAHSLAEKMLAALQDSTKEE